MKPLPPRVAAASLAERQTVRQSLLAMANALMLDFTPLSKAVATLASAFQGTAGLGDDLLARDGWIE
jgi:hypothetical protein